MSSRSPDALLRRLEWTVIRRLDGLLQGDYRTLFRGFGLDLADLREYQYGDDVRHIDWNVTARLQAPYVRKFHEDREITAWFLLDLSQSVAFGSHQRRKQSISEDFVAVIARVLTRHGNRVGALYFGENVNGMIPARSGRRQVLSLLQGMQRHAGAKTEGKGTDLNKLLTYALNVIKRRSLVFIVSDFISVPGWAERLAQLAHRHQLAQRREVVAVRLYDPLESELPDLGLLVFQDAETGEQLLVDTHDPGFRRRFAEGAQRREKALRAAFRDAGVDALELSTDEDLLDALLRFTGLRRRRSRLTAAAQAVA